MENYIAQNHPSIHSNELPPDKVIFIECLIETGKCRVSNVIHDIVHSRLGDDDIREVSNKKSGGANISPVMRCYSGSLHMVNTNKYLKEKKKEMERNANAKGSSSKAEQDQHGKFETTTRSTQFL